MNMHKLIEKNRKLLDKLLEELKKFDILAFYVKNPKEVSPFSDIDCYVVIEKKDMKNLYSERKKVLNSVGNTLTIWGNKFGDGKFSVNAVFKVGENPLKVDINTKFPQDIKPSYKLKETEILFDTDDLVLNAKTKSSGLSQDLKIGEIDKEELQLKIDQFYGWLYNTLSKIYKGYFESVVFEHLPEYLNSTIIPLYFAYEQKKSEGFYKAGERIDGDFLSKIKELQLNFNQKDLVEDLFKIIKMFQFVAGRVCVKYGLEYPRKAEEVALREIEEKFNISQ